MHEEKIWLENDEVMTEASLVGLDSGSDGNKSAYNVGDSSLIFGLWRSPGEGNGQPTPVFLPGKSHGLRSLAGYSPWGRKESDTTEQTNTFTFLS